MGCSEPEAGSDIKGMTLSSSCFESGKFFSETKNESAKKEKNI